MSPVSIFQRRKWTSYMFDGWCMVKRDRSTHYLVHAASAALYLSLCGQLLSPDSFVPYSQDEHCVLCERILTYQQHRDSVAHGGK
jgi:hypothetical protein